MDFLDVIRIAARETADRRTEVRVGDGLDGLEVVRGGDGEAGLDDVDAELGELRFGLVWKRRWWNREVVERGCGGRGG
jgi:hypothetical protein